MSDATQPAIESGDNPIISDFLNPNSMLTPGFAGGVTMMMTNTLCSFFAIPVALTGLAISALFGTLAIGSSGTLLRRGVYYVLNSLIIFCVAMGTGNIANQLERRSINDQSSLSIIGTAHAQAMPEDRERSERYIKELAEITGNPNLTSDQKLEQIKTINKKWKSEQPMTSGSKKDPNGFFKSWSITKQ